MRRRPPRRLEQRQASPEKSQVGEQKSCRTCTGAGPAERLERLGALPIRLGDKADAETLSLEQPPDDRHAEARMVDISVAGNQNDIADVPAEVRPKGAIREERLCAPPLDPVNTGSPGVLAWPSPRFRQGSAH